MKKSLLLITALSLLVATNAFAAKTKPSSGPCKVNIPIPAHALYKSENVHGGRGPSLITSYGNTRQWPACTSVNIYNKNGANIGRFGCYDPGHLPYGRRFYTGVVGGSYTNASGLYNGARKAGSSAIYIDASNYKKNTCWIVNSPYSRAGGI